MTTTVVTEEPVAPTEEPVTTEAAEAVAEAHVTAEEAHAEARVEVAEIEAARDEAIAETNAEVAVAAIEAATVSDKHQAELEECRTNIAQMQTALSALTEQQALILQRLPPQPPPTNQESGAPEVTPDNQEAPAAPAKAKKKLRLI